MSDPLELFYPLADWELNQLRQGYTATPHYHDVPQRGDVVMVVIGKSWRKGDYDHLRKQGINLAGIRLTDEMIDRLRNNIVLTFVFGPFQVHLLKKELLDNLEDKVK
ncbi:MAG: hypothetical protein ACETVR_04690 [Candidatus Bathyarchaeia archaeon]